MFLTTSFKRYLRFSHWFALPSNNIFVTNFSIMPFKLEMRGTYLTNFAQFLEYSKTISIDTYMEPSLGGLK